MGSAVGRALRAGGVRVVATVAGRSTRTVALAEGLEFVDGSNSAGPPLPHGATVVYLAGPRAAEVAALPAPGVDMHVAGDEIGLASAVKMSTASVYKGRLALLTQALRAAHANGVLEHVLADLRRSDAALVDRASPMLQRGASVSGRYVGEMSEIAASQAAAGLSPDLFEAFGEVFADISRSSLAALEPEQVDPTVPVEDLLDRL